ncbi:hypothetical protein QYF36_002282 [Acer negundo]|nr:hypothetical protein QYF36_002282 [Acer negundo]
MEVTVIITILLVSRDLDRIRNPEQTLIADGKEVVTDRSTSWEDDSGISLQVSFEVGQGLILSKYPHLDYFFVELFYVGSQHLTPFLDHVLKQDEILKTRLSSLHGPKFRISRLAPYTPFS